MASKAIADAPRITGEAEKIGDVLAIPVDEIDASDRLRPIDTQWATSLGQIMLAEGQRTPIEVCKLPGQKKWTLVSGGHRHWAAGLFLDLSPLKAIVVDNSALERRASEISENLHRKGLEPMERAIFIAELIKVQKLRMGVDPDKDGRAASAQARWQKQVAVEAKDATATIAVAYGWADEVAERTHLSARTIYDDLLLVRRIPAGLIEMLRKDNHAVLRSASQLKALAKLDDYKQRQAVELLCWKGASLGKPQPRNVAEAIAAMDQKPKKTPEDKRLSAFIGAFQRMSTAEKKGALEHLSALLPAGFKLVGGVA